MDEGKLSTARASGILAILGAVFAVNYMDRQILALLIEPIRYDLHLSDTQAGTLYGFAFALFYSTLGIPIASLADRSSRVRIIAGSLALFSVMTAVCGMAVSFWQLLLARVGVAVGEAGTNPPSHSIIADLYPVERRSTAMALFSLGPHAGILLGFAVGGLSAQWLGWRLTFVAAGVFGLVLLPVALFVLTEPAREPLASVQAAGGSVVVTVKALWRHRSLRHLFAAVSVSSIAVAVTTGWLPSFLIRSHRFSVASAGLLLALILGVVGAAGTLLSGVLADRLGKRNPGARLHCVAVGSLVAIVAWAIVLGSEQPPLMITGLMIGGALVAFHLGPSFAMVQTLAPPGSRALAASLLLFVGNLVGVGIGPLAVGALSDVLVARYGVDSLRIAMLLVLPVYLWAACHYFAAAKTVASDMREIAAGNMGTVEVQELSRAGSSA